MERKLFTLIAALGLALTACTAPTGDPPEESPEPTAEEGIEDAVAESPAPEETAEEDPAGEDPAGAGEEPAPEPTTDPPAPAPSAATLPSCEGLLGPDEFAFYFFEMVDDVELLSPLPNWGPAADHIADAEVSSVLEQASDIESCTWGVPFTDAFFTVVMAAVSPDLAEQARVALEAAGAPIVHPPLAGYVTEQEDAMSVAVHRIETDVIFSFQGGPGSANADDAQRHGFAAILQTISGATAR